MSENYCDFAVRPSCGGLSMLGKLIDRRTTDGQQAISTKFFKEPNLINNQTTFKMTIEEYKNKFTEEDSVGWDCIDAKFDVLYPNQEPKHYATILKYSLGGEDPLDGFSVYESTQQMNHWHLVTYGFSELYYNEEACGEAYSKFGFELTFRLKKETNEEEDFIWAINLMKNISKYIFSSGKWFEPYHFIPANGPIKLGAATEIVALAFVIDEELGVMETPHGEVQFLQMVGITGAEYEALKANPTLGEVEKLMNELKVKNPLLITNLDRKSSS